MLMAVIILPLLFSHYQNLCLILIFLMSLNVVVTQWQSKRETRFNSRKNINETKLKILNVFVDVIILFLEACSYHQ